MYLYSSWARYTVRAILFVVASEYLDGKIYKGGSKLKATLSTYFHYNGGVQPKVLLVGQNVTKDSFQRQLDVSCTIFV